MDAVYLEGELIGKVYYEDVFEDKKGCTDSTHTIRHAKINDIVVNVPLAEGNAEGAVEVQGAEKTIPITSVTNQDYHFPTHRVDTFPMFL